MTRGTDPPHAVDLDDQGAPLEDHVLGAFLENRNLGLLLKDQDRGLHLGTLMIGCLSAR